jgi:hypothetical protein
LREDDALNHEALPESSKEISGIVRVVFRKVDREADLKPADNIGNERTRKSKIQET